MAITGHSFTERVTRWQVLAENLKGAEGLDHIAADLQLLEERLAEARGLENKMEDLRSQFRTLTARARKLVTEGDTLRSRIGASLQSKHGFTSETLLKYGIKPRRVPRRRSKKPEAGTTPPAAQAGAEEPVKTRAAGYAEEN